MPPSTGPLRLIGYCRVSSAAQADRGVSLDAQATALVRYVNQYGHVLTSVEAEQASARGPASRRPVLAGVLADLERRRADGLAVMYLDRLSRDIGVVLELAAQARVRGWHLMATEDRFDTTTPMGRFQLHMLAGVAALQSDLIGRNVKTSLASLSRQGRCVSRFTPFGFRLGAWDGPWATQARARDEHGRRVGAADQRLLVPHAEELALRDMIVDRIDRGDTYAEVLRELRLRQVPYPRGGPWRSGTLQAIYRTAVRGRHVPDLDLA